MFQPTRRTLFAATALLFVTSLSYAAEPEEFKLEKVVITVMEQLEVPAQAEGSLSRVDVKEGDVLQQGDAIARIRDDDAKLEIARQRINLENAIALAENTVAIRLAKKERERAHAELSRAERWGKKVKDAVSKSEIERLQLALDKAELDIEQATEDLKTAQRAVDAHKNEVSRAENLLLKRSIRSPVRGVVVHVAKHRGSWVKPGDAVVRVLRLDRLRVEAILPREMLLKPLKGSRVVVSIDLPDRGTGEYEGRIVFVRPELNPLNNQIRVWAEIENDELLLRPGLSGSMTIHLNEQDDSQVDGNASQSNLVADDDAKKSP